MARWSAAPVEAAELPDQWLCSAPFSFFSDVIEQFFAATTNRAPIHRICTLMRQQGANLLVAESVLSRPDVIEEITALDARYNGGGDAQAIALSFFKVAQGVKKLDDASAPRLLAHAILINYRAKGYSNFTHSYVYEAILPPPGRTLGRPLDFPRTLVLPLQEFNCTVLDRTFGVQGVLYCQQNDTLHVCAHSCLRMAIGSSQHSTGKISSNRINRLLGIREQVGSLDSGQIAEIIDACGLKAAVRTKLQPDEYLSELAALIDSGYMALLGFTTKQEKGRPIMGHVVTAFGHSRNANQWHAQAMQTYSGPRSSPYLPSSSWIDNFIIHDDNLGPYLSLSARSFMRNPVMRLNCVIGLLPESAISSNHAELIAAGVLSHLLPLVREDSTNYWIRYLTEQRDVPILRSVLMTKAEYMEHLKCAKAHDRTRMDAFALSKLDSLDGSFWMVEFSLPPLYTGNGSKLGEVLVSAREGVAGGGGKVLAVRLPGSVLSLVGDDILELDSCKLASHSAIYEKAMVGGLR